MNFLRTKFIRVCLIILGLLLLSGVSIFIWIMLFLQFIPPVRFEELIRQVNPGNTLDAFVVRSDAGATTDFGYQVYIASHGDQSGKVLVCRAYHGKIAALKWLNENHLSIHLDGAEILSNQSVVKIRNSRNDDESVRISTQ
jgi:hypothetical protein